MKKGISPFIATILLIGFTVAVGAILSVWFTTFTRTQTVGIQAGAACITNKIDVKVLGIGDNTTTLLIQNSGPDSVRVTSIIMTCGGVIVNSTNLNLSISPNSQEITSVIGTAACNAGNIGLDVLAVCGRGGTTSAQCREGTCFGP